MKSIWLNIYIPNKDIISISNAQAWVTTDKWQLDDSFIQHMLITEGHEKAQS